MPLGQFHWRATSATPFGRIQGHLILSRWRCRPLMAAPDARRAPPPSPAVAAEEIDLRREDPCGRVHWDAMAYVVAGVFAVLRLSSAGDHLGQVHRRATSAARGWSNGVDLCQGGDAGPHKWSFPMVARATSVPVISGRDAMRPGALGRLRKAGAMVVAGGIAVPGPELMDRHLPTPGQHS
jgi:hypothetical protein